MAEGLFTRRSDLWPTLAVGALALAGYLSVSPGGFSLGDGPELAASATLLGVPHPPGYPLFTVLGHLFTALAGDGLRGLWLLSILAVSAAAGFVFATLRLVGLKRWGAFLGALLFSCSAIAVRGAVFVEVYGFALFGLAVVLWAVCRCVFRESAARDVLTLALCYGLALAHHPTQAFLAPAVLYAVVRFARDNRPPAAFYALLAAAGLVGLSAYLYLPLRTAAVPAVAWFEPDNLERLGFVLGGAAYGEFWGVSGDYFWSNVSLLAGYLSGQLPAYLAAASLGGFVLLGRKKPLLTSALAAAALLNLYWTARYAAVDRVVFLLLGCFIFVLAAVYAVGWGLERLWGWAEKGPALSKIITGTAAAALAALAVVAYLDASEPEDLAALPHGRNLLRCAPPGAVVLFHGDLSFPLLHLRYDADGRPDVIVADEGGMITSSRTRALAGQRNAAGAALFYADPPKSAAPTPIRWGYGYLWPLKEAERKGRPEPHFEPVGPGGLYADETAARYLLARLELPGGEALWETIGKRASLYAGSSPHAHLALGRWLLGKNPVAAEREFRRAAELEPWMPSARYNLALALLARNDTAGAVEELEAALAGFAEPEVKVLAARLLSELRWRPDLRCWYNR